MFYKVLSVLVLASICSGETSHQKYPPEYAISSQSYKRDDVPLSYKHSVVHLYTTRQPPSAAHEPHNEVPKDGSGKYGNLQYAPLISSSSIFSKLSPSQSADINEFSVTSKRDHLEPKTSKPEMNTKMLPISQSHRYPLSHPHPYARPGNLDYIPGHNIEVLQSANRYPGHNAVYRSNAEVTPDDRQNKIGYSRQYLVYQNPARKQELESSKLHQSTSSPLTEPITESTKDPTSPKAVQFYEGKFTNNLYNTGKKKTQIMEMSVHKSPYTKMHALLLNVARSYNFVPHSDLHAGFLGQPHFIIPGSHNQQILKMNSKINVIPAMNRPFSLQ